MSSYATAWCVYLLSAAGILILLWILCSWRSLVMVRVPLLLLSAALLLVPVEMAEQPGWYAPSVMGAAIALLDDGVDAMWVLLELPLESALLLVLGWGLWRLSHWGYRRYSRPGEGLAKSPVAMATPRQADNDEPPSKEPVS